MKTIKASMLLAVVLVISATMPALSQSKGPATQFFGSVCEIDLRQISGLPPAFQRSEFTLSTTKSCAGTPSLRNAKLVCEDTIRDWTFGDRSAKNFVCTINGKICNLPAKPGDPNAPLVTTTVTTLTVSSAGKAKLTCFYKP